MCKVLSTEHSKLLIQYIYVVLSLRPHLSAGSHHLSPVGCKTPNSSPRLQHFLTPQSLPHTRARVIFQHANLTGIKEFQKSSLPKKLIINCQNQLCLRSWNHPKACSHLGSLQMAKSCKNSEIYGVLTFSIPVFPVPAPWLPWKTSHSNTSNLIATRLVEIALEFL